MGIFEKIHPLARLRRRQVEKDEREWRFVRLGVCPRCAVPLAVSREDKFVWYRCLECRNEWGETRQRAGESNLMYG